ncbi:MAG: transcription antitermination factor NusB [Armatimonadetes bacterium]|nr:transcription antitermination factor NusB [Armatimonadota bacterium]MDW8122149.1 transcription antitermination factor NusB [Armatimonadota bacterium]
MSRRRSRELALQILFQADVADVPIEEALHLTLEEIQDQDYETVSYTQTIVEEVWLNRESLDRILDSCSQNWPVERMSAVDKNILRIATYEILFRDDVPPAVAINEAVELAKKYGTEESPRFVNGVLSGVAKKTQTGEKDQPSSGGDH